MNINSLLLFALTISSSTATLCMHQNEKDFRKERYQQNNRTQERKDAQKSFNKKNCQRNRSQNLSPTIEQPSSHKKANNRK